MTPEQRTAIYTLASAVGAIALVYGAVTEEQAAVFLSAFAALLGTVTAFFNRPTKDEG